MNVQYKLLVLNPSDYFVAYPLYGNMALYLFYNRVTVKMFQVSMQCPKHPQYFLQDNSIGLVVIYDYCLLDQSHNKNETLPGGWSLSSPHLCFEKQVIFQRIVKDFFTFYFMP